MRAAVLFLCFLCLQALVLCGDPPIQYTKKIAGGIEAAQVFADMHGDRLVRRVSEGMDVYIFERDTDVARRGQALPPGVVVQERRERKHRFLTPTDPNYNRQWHLHGHGPFNRVGYVHINATGAWDLGYAGEGFLGAVVDDGLDYSTDLAANFVSSHSMSVVGDSVMPYGQDTHGTQAAGLAFAAKDARCGVGVAFLAKVASMRLLPRLHMPTDAEEASALAHMAYDVRPVCLYSNSWGTSDNGRLLGEVGPLMREAMDHAFLHGCNETGANYVWASGNGRTVDDQANLDGLCNAVTTICVAAIGDMGYAARYSEGGACVMLAAPSTGGIYGISTTMPNSYSGCTNTFSGTSAAAPQVAGVVALVRGANPRLSARDVMHILVRTAAPHLTNGDPIVNTAFEANGAGLLHDDYVGFGIVNAGRAVELARNWTNVAARNEYDVTVPIMDSARDISAGQARAYAATVFVRDSNVVYDLEHVVLEVDIDFRNCEMRALESIKMMSPMGTESRLLSHNNHLRNKLVWKFSSVKHWGEHPSGTWTFGFSNEGRGTIHVNSLKLYMYGTERSINT